MGDEMSGYYMSRHERAVLSVIRGFNEVKDSLESYNPMSLFAEFEAKVIKERISRLEEMADRYMEEYKDPNPPFKAARNIMLEAVEESGIHDEIPSMSYRIKEACKKPARVAKNTLIAIMPFSEFYYAPKLAEKLDVSGWEKAGLYVSSAVLGAAKIGIYSYIIYSYITGDWTLSDLK